MIDGDPPGPEWALWRENINICILQINASKTHVAAWGNEPVDYVRRFLQDLADASDCEWDEEEYPPVEFLCLGKTLSGAPKHPLARGKHRVPSDFKPVPWKLSP